MDLVAYLKARGETEISFARRSGVPQQSVNRICHGDMPAGHNMLRIVHASRRDPAPDGGTVTYEELILYSLEENDVDVCFLN